MRNKHIHVLIHMRIKGEVGTVKLKAKVIFLLTVPRLCLFCGSFLVYMFCDYE